MLMDQRLCFICRSLMLLFSNCLFSLRILTIFRKPLILTYGHISGAHFSVSKAYVHLTGHRVIHATFKWLWKSSCQNKHNVFFWLLLKDRLSTRELLRRRNMNIPDYSCVFCPSTEDESLEHLFISCWAKIDLLVGDDDPFATLEHLKHQLGVPFFMDIIILMSWCIWMQRNDLTFKGIHMHVFGTSRKNLA